jgi:hypothetical protein
LREGFLENNCFIPPPVYKTERAVVEERHNQERLNDEGHVSSQIVHDMKRFMFISDRWKSTGSGGRGQNKIIVVGRHHRHIAPSCIYFGFSYPIYIIVCIPPI